MSLSMRSAMGVAWVLVALLVIVPAQAAGNAERGKKLGYTCLGCHGIPNYHNANPSYRVPRLMGQSPEYLVAALNGYKNGDRSHTTMHAHAASMSDQDMLDIAAYLSGAVLRSEPGRKGNAEPPKAAAVCVSCHGNDGVGIAVDYPTLAGQYSDYLERTLVEYKKGGRKNAVMAGFASQLSDADINAIADFYSKQSPTLGTPVRRMTSF